MPNPSRHKSRILAFQIIYSRGKLGLNSVGENKLLKESGLPPKFHDFSIELVDTTWQNLETIDKAIQDHLKNWKQNRLTDTLNALLRMSVCELLYFDAIENKVVFNEAIEICREYVDEQATRICNGVLHAVSENILHHTGKE